MWHTIIYAVIDRSSGEIQSQCGTIKLSLKTLHGKSLSGFVRIIETDSREVDRFLFAREHFFFAVQSVEFPVRRVCVRCIPVEGPCHLARTGLLDLSSLFIGESKNQ